MKEKDFKPIAKEVFSRLGLKIKDLETSDTVQKPDFEVSGNTDKYTVELKIKDDNIEEIEEETQSLARGELVGKSIPVGPRNTLAGIIRKGVAQLLSHDPTGETYRVIWLHSAGQDSEVHNMRFHATLFGTESLFGLRLPNVVTCYYFHESAFYAWRKYLDGAILTYIDGAQAGINMQLCINTLSPRVNDFRQSELVERLSNGLCDVDTLHGIDNGVLIADCPCDRKDSTQILVYLKTKYKLDHLQDIPMRKYSGKILIDHNKDC
jgi:hypothetical protein